MASKAQKRAAKAAARAQKTLATKKAEETKVVEEPKPTTETKTAPTPVATKTEEKKPTVTPTKPAEKPADPKPAEKKPEVKQEQTKEEVKPQPSQSKEQPKQETKKEPTKPAPKKPSKPKKGEEVPVIPVEEVKEPEPQIKESGRMVAAVIRNEADGRIDANHSIDLMTAIERRYLSSSSNAPEELKKIMSSQFDAMMWVNLNRWNEQTKADFGEANLIVNEDMFTQMQKGLAEVFGITLKALPHKEGDDPKQMVIDFDATNKTASQETQESIKEAVKAPTIKEFPKYQSNMTEEQCIEALNVIANSNSKHNVQEKLQAMVDFTRKAWKLPDAEVSKVLSVMLNKLQNPKCFVLSCWSNITYGGITAHVSPFVTHCLIREKIKDYGYNEKQIADIVRFFVVLRATNNCGNDLSGLPKRLKELTALMGVFDNKLITKMVEAYNKKKDFEIPKVSGWAYDGKKEFNVQKVVETIKTSYGNLKQKELIKKIEEIANLYNKEFKAIEA